MKLVPLLTRTNRTDLGHHHQLEGQSQALGGGHARGIPSTLDPLGLKKRQEQQKKYKTLTQYGTLKPQLQVERYLKQRSTPGAGGPGLSGGNPGPG